ncbi:MAG: hypothetical protein ACKKMR_00750 [Candidatus Nealsonbacteria bacterium]
MKVFEFHFNPKIKSNLVFDSFCYEPENLYEKRMGSLYIVGFLKNVLPQNTHFIEKLVKVVKDKYYRSTTGTPEKSLKATLKTANEFLEGITQKGDVSWLGNISFTILSLKDFKLNFTKVGNIKILVLRGGKIIDIDKKITLQDIEPYPLKIFINTVSGKLTENDVILVLTEDIFDFFQKQDMLNEIAQLTPLTEKGLKEILNKKEELLFEISGVFMAVLLTKEVFLGKKETVSPKLLKKFSLKEAFSPFLNLFKKIRKSTFPPLGLKAKLMLPQIIVPKTKLSSSRKKIKAFLLNKNLSLIFVLVILLSLGFFLSRFEQERNIKIYNKDLAEIRQKLILADSLLILKEASPEAIQKANLLLKESWEEISSLSKKVMGLPETLNYQVSTLKDDISEKLAELNKLERIENPQVLFEFERKTFVPLKFLVFNENLYFFNPYSKNIFQLKENGEKNIIETEQEIDFAASLDDSISFFSKPEQLIILKNNKLTHPSLEIPYPDFNSNDFSSFRKNIYFLDKKEGQIIKYPFLRNLKWDSPRLWLDSKTTKVMGADSFAIDTAIWILKENSIYKYYEGIFEKEIGLEIFPSPKDFSKIFTSPILPYLYILEPVQKRIVILDKSGNIIKQFQSEKFDNLLDFGVSENGKIIYLLNSLKVYKIEF